MNRILTSRFLIVAISLVGLPAGAEQKTEHSSGYMDAIRQELARLDKNAVCETTPDECAFDARIGADGPNVKVKIRYSAITATVYIYIDRLLALNDVDGPSLALSRRLLELNGKMVTSKLEWDPVTNSVRLSVVLNTDSNFDRKAFRSQIKGLLATAEKILPLLSVPSPGSATS